jgi:hypothetical protein
LSLHGKLQSVFVSLLPVPFPLELSADEIEAYRWASFDNFTHALPSDFQTAILKPKFISIDDWVLQKALGFMGVKASPQIECFVGGALLPMQPTVQVEDPGADCNSEFHLWGITYRVNCR